MTPPQSEPGDGAIKREEKHKLSTGRESRKTKTNTKRHNKQESPAAILNGRSLAAVDEKRHAGHEQRPPSTAALAAVEVERDRDRACSVGRVGTAGRAGRTAGQAEQAWQAWQARHASEAGQAWQAETLGQAVQGQQAGQVVHAGQARQACQLGQAGKARQTGRPGRQSKANRSRPLTAASKPRALGFFCLKQIRK